MLFCLKFVHVLFTGIFARFGFTERFMFLEIPAFVIFSSPHQIERELESICNEALNILTQNLLKVTKGKRDESEVCLEVLPLRVTLPI